MVQGRVVAYRAGDAEMPAVWRVIHDDGDEEDLEEAELKEAFQLWDSRNAPGNPSSNKQRVAPNGNKGPALKSKKAPSPDEHVFVKGVQKGDSCGVCLCDMHDDRAKPHALMKLNSCGHIFHSECLRSCSAQWRNVCPLCKVHYSVRRELPPKPRKR